ncbi:MAG: VC2046/SO_2500 family protein [Pseudoalteromonas sp.]|uniref:VC2046/SO_2500 family protein n=1 Tax=unclassified Pseudoalteromonas TaxID=194690 RepID=UPI003F9847FB
MLVGQHNAKRLRESGLGDIRLRHYLTPELLVIRDDKTPVSLGIIDNYELVVRKRHQQSHIHGETPVMDAAAFYAGLTNSDLHQSLHLTSA